MFEDSKTIFISHPYYAVNNPSNNLRIYKKAKNSNSWTYIQCKDKNEYRKEINNYVIGFFGYSRNEKKAHESVNSFVNESSDSSLFDYFMGGKKSIEDMNKNQMKREEMAMLKDGTFLLDKDVPLMQKRWSHYIENSNIQLTVLSFYQDYVDKNISIKELQRIVATDIMPKFLSYCGYENPKKNLEWVVALHNDRENNYHFHISWIEKNKCYRQYNNQLGHRIKLLLSEKENNFIKRQVVLAIERSKEYRPALIKLEEELEKLNSYFNPKDKNFTLKNIKDIELEEKIIKLGFLLNIVRSTDKKYIKYNSLPKNDIGSEIRKLTKEIKKEIFKDNKIKIANNKISSAISKINDILIDIDRRNNISNVGFENILDNKLIKSKLDKSETYVLNSIVNHALYNFNYHKKNLSNKDFKLEDIINQVAYESYINDFKKTNKVKKYKTKILHNYFSNKTYKSKVIRALERLDYAQQKAAEKFYEMFEEENNYKNER